MEATTTKMEQMITRPLARGFLGVQKLELSLTTKKYIFTTSAYVCPSIGNAHGNAHIFV